MGGGFVGMGGRAPHNPLLHPVPPEGRQGMHGRGFDGMGGWGRVWGRFPRWPCIPKGCKAIESRALLRNATPNHSPFHCLAIDAARLLFTPDC